MNTVTALSAVQQIRRMHGGSQSQLMRASDGHSYITKFQGNPQHTRVLANEFLASRLGSYLGLAMPEVELIEVSEWLVSNTPELRFDMAGLATPCSSGLQPLMERIRNLQDFARVLLL